MNATSLHRRRLMAAACAVIAVLALAWGLPRVAATAHAQSPIRYVAATAQAKTPIRHVVVIYLENHSFDNVLGFWCQAHQGRCPDGGMPSSVRLSNGAVVTPHAMPDTVPNVDHTVPSQLAAMHIVRGVPQMNGWQNIKDGGCAATATPPYACVAGLSLIHI